VRRLTIASLLCAGLFHSLALIVPAQAQTRSDIVRALEEVGVHTVNSNMPAAIASARRAVEMAEKLYGPEHPDVAACLMYLALATGDPAHALRALAIHERAQGEQHADTAATLEQLGIMVFATPEAEGHLKRAVAIYEKIGPPKKLHSALKALETYYTLMNRSAEAEALKSKLDMAAKKIAP
jgi:hypothetical protein